ncbi:aminotransferase class V-fold PLP-dependent enzyme [Herpetosiphon llansteffanensis]
MHELVRHFAAFRRQIVGIDQHFMTPYGSLPIVYADWTASGRLYAPIEQQMLHVFGPFVGNTHSESNVTGTSMTEAYHFAQRLIKQHVNAASDDVLILAGSGMTAVVNKFQRILGLRMPEQWAEQIKFAKHERPVVFISHMEHHSNHTSWLETIAEVVVVPPDEQGLIDPANLDALLPAYAERSVKIGAFTACSNVTGIRTPYHQLARVMHAHGGVCFVDFSASAPYVAIDMHPTDSAAALDAIYFSPHKCLGGPATPGVLVFSSKLYHNRVPDQPGGGTVNWTNPWMGHSFISDIEAREDGGTPAFLQTIKAALALQLKQTMGVEQIEARETQLTQRLFQGLRSIQRLHILADHVEQRQGIFSFYIENLHYNLVVQLLNDHFGVQVRGGCSCAGTYGHYLLHVDPQRSKRITDRIDQGDLSGKPGWVRLSIHPTTTDQEADYVLDALDQVVRNSDNWANDYQYSNKTNEWRHRQPVQQDIGAWFQCCDLVEH